MIALARRVRGKAMAGWLLIAVLALSCLWTGHSWWAGSRVKSLGAECRLAYERQDWSALESAARRWTESDADRVDAWLYLAEAANRRGDYAQAAKHLERIPASAPGAVNALIGLMDLQFGPLNRPLDGVATCERILMLEPDSAIAHQRLIFFSAMTLQRPKLIRQIRQAIERRCEPREAYVYLLLADSLRLSNGAASNTQWLASDPDSELFLAAQAVHTAVGLEGGIPQDAPEVVRVIRKAAAAKDQILADLLRRFPRNVELLAYQLGQSLTAGDVERVRQLLSQAPKAAEEDNRFWRFRGWFLAQNHQHEQAERAYGRALTLHPLDWTTRHQLAELHRRRGNFDEVARLQKLASQGRELAHRFLQSPNARAVAPQLFAELANYAEVCGDAQVASALQRRLKTDTSR
jgi:tetratricopeptide (TPR) repeat protein